MSIERMRVASSDWCASRMVVSVISSWRCASIQSANACGPFCSSRLRVPISGSPRAAGGRGGLDVGARAVAGPWFRDARSR